MMTQEHIGRYEIKEELGRGGMATVFHAFDPQFKRDVAIKVLPRELLHDKEFRSRFEREATTVAGLEHSAIVPVYDFGEQDEQPYLVMRYISGGSLTDRIQHGPMPLGEVVRIVSHIAPALDYAHQHGVVHRDLKPDNILFDSQEEPYLTDFGIAKLSESSATLTGSAIVGTPAYMSPEQGRGDANLDGRSDQYSLGIIVYEMLTGKVPYEANTPMGQVLKHLTEPVPNILEALPGLPPGVQAVMAQVLAKRSYVRFPSVREFAAALDRAVRGDTLSASGPVAVKETMMLPGDALRPRPGSYPKPSRPPTGKVSSRPGRASSPGRAASGVRKKKGGGSWLLLALFLLVIGGAAGYYFFGDQLQPLLADITSSGSAAAMPAATSETSQAVSTPAQTILVTQIVVQVTATPKPVQQATQTPAPSATLAPTVQPTAAPMGPVVGGADQIAFVGDNDIWISNMDGSGLKRLTQTGGSKLGLQWTPEGDAITFIAGRCVQRVTIADAQISTVMCVNWADSLGGFEISPDGSRVALSMSYGLFVLDYDLEALSQVRTRAQLDSMQKCINYREYPMKSVRWSRDGKSVAVMAQITDLGRSFDQILVLDVSRCGQPPVKIDEFPHKKFDDMRGYFNNPVLVDFAWDGDLLFALNVNTVNNYGEIYLYNMGTKKAEVIDPLSARCCYRNFRWSPNLEYFFFSFQDQRFSANPQAYNIIFGTIGTGASYQPLPFGPDVLPTRLENLQPVFRFQR